MNPLFEACWELHQFLKDHQIRYVIIGGFALIKWGDLRFTKDVDLTISVPLDQGLEPIVQLITGHFSSRVKDPIAFTRRTRMLLISSSNGVDADISLSLPGYEDEMFARAIEYELEPEKFIHLCSAEDLIIHKLVAGRPQDISDVQGILYRQKGKLDVGYIRLWLKEFGSILDNLEVSEGFERMLKEL